METAKIFLILCSATALFQINEAQDIPLPFGGGGGLIPGGGGLTPGGGGLTPGGGGLTPGGGGLIPGGGKIPFPNDTHGIPGIPFPALNMLYQRSLEERHEVNVFQCNVQPRSSPVPTSVHSLRPADIKVVGAMGDSMTAGTGVTATTIVEELKQNRGLSWSGGGQGRMESHLTMPNILKKYNKDLYGYATGDGNEDNVRAHFNVAVPGSDSGDLEKQARELADRMKSDKSMDFINDWKVITVLTGNNDLCDSCKKPEEYSAAQLYENLVRALDVLHMELPRTLVNLVAPLNMGLVTALNKGFLCSTVHFLICECAAFPKSKEEEQKLQRLTEQYHKTVQEIASSGRYDTRDDFTVVYQPLFNGTYLPKKEDGQPDMSYFAPDCFHLSSRGQAAAGLTLWNNMISPIQEKEGHWSPNDKMRCPSEDQPYIYTNRNSYPEDPEVPATEDDSGHFPKELLVVTTVCGVVVVIIGSAVIIGVVRRLRSRDLYIQIPQ